MKLREKKSLGLFFNMNSKNSLSIFEKNIQRGIDKQQITISEDQLTITYHCKRDYSTYYSNPEEKVRASYFIELVLDYDYPAESIDLEVTVQRSIPGDYADIVVYNKDGKEYLVVECKRDGITDNEFKQAIEQVFGNANRFKAFFASVVAGNTKTAFTLSGFKPSEREKNVISDIPKGYGQTPKYKFIKGDELKDLNTVSKEELIRALEKSHNTVWQGGKLAPTNAFDEVSKLLFCKLKDEKSTIKHSPYEFQIGSYETVKVIFERIDGIYQSAKKEDAEVFKEDIQIEPRVVYSVVEHLQELAITKIDLDTKGLAFERFMEDFFKGKMGQFFTPREVINFCVKMINLQRSDLIIDPACGSGGFLLSTMDLIKENAESNYDKEDALQHWHKFARDNLFGIEINDQIARVCKMNMIIHDDGHTNIISTDSLKPMEEITKIHKSFKRNQFDILLTNPPFGAIVKSTEKNYLDSYTLGINRKNQKTEILFIERCFDFLKEGGKMAIILPDGILTNTSSQYVRDYILERVQILAVVSLPQITFVHFGTGVKSSVIFLKKKEKDEKLGKFPIFMGIANHIGYDASGRKDPINDFDDILIEYRKFEKSEKGNRRFGTKSFVLDYNDIDGRLDAEYYKPEYTALNKKLATSSNFEIVRFEDIIDIISSGATPKIEGNFYSDSLSGIYFLRVQNITKKGINLENVKYINREVHETMLKRSQLRENDLIFTITGKIGVTAVVPKNFEGNINQHSVKITLKEYYNSIKILPGYIALYFNLPIGQKLSFREITGITRPALTYSALKELSVPLPSFKVQEEILEKFKFAQDQAKMFEKKAKEELDKAKTEIEKIIWDE